EVAVARAARAKGHLMMLSTVATSSIEDVTAAAGTPVWQQLYPTNVWEVSGAIVKRAEAAGSPAIVLTVDLQEGSNRETLFRSQLVDKRSEEHTSELQSRSDLVCRLLLEKKKKKKKQLNINN